MELKIMKVHTQMIRGNPPPFYYRIKIVSINLILSNLKHGCHSWGKGFGAAKGGLPKTYHPKPQKGKGHLVPRPNHRGNIFNRGRKRGEKIGKLEDIPIVQKVSKGPKTYYNPEK